MVENDNVVPSLTEESDLPTPGGPEEPVKVKPVNLETARRIRRPPPGNTPPDALTPTPVAEPAPATATPALPDVANLLQRVELLEESVTRLDRRRLGQETATVKLDDLQAGLRGVTEQLRALTARLDQLAATGSATIGAGARDNFVCPGCRARGQVATRLTCTSCGNETWWGWWPPRQP